MIFSHLDPDSRFQNPLERRFYKGGTPSAAADPWWPSHPSNVGNRGRASLNPPVSESLTDFSAESREAKRRASSRKGFRSTILAGESGVGFGGTVNTDFGQKTLLGG